MSRLLGFPVEHPQLPNGLSAVPVRTRLVRAGDDLPDIIADAVAGIAQPPCVIAIAETAVAIAQGRCLAAETIRPSRLAHILARNAGALATVNQPESMQLVIDDVGVSKVVGAAALHVVGRLFGRRGVFYEILGESIAAIDGYTGTLPPFERMIVLGPKDPDITAQAIAERIGAACVIVDANDLGRAKVLGASHGVERHRVEQALEHNPHGNGDEQTPIVVVLWRADGPHPLLNEETIR